MMCERYYIMPTSVFLRYENVFRGFEYFPTGLPPIVFLENIRQNIHLRTGTPMVLRDSWPKTKIKISVSVSISLLGYLNYKIYVSA